jgi:glutaredoxin
MSSVRLAALAALVGWAALSGAGATAQQVYRIVGPDGRVTFSDRPPADANAARAAQPVPVPGAAGTPTANPVLPLELRNAASRFPVTIYTGTDCAPCLSARSFLSARGVPFTERTVTTEDDALALQRIAGVARLPIATIGGQHIRGYSEVEWGEYLDAAGYPKVSQLPATWRNPPATPLVAVQAPPQRSATPAQAPAPQRAEVTPVNPNEPAPSNPAGIRF